MLFRFRFLSVLFFEGTYYYHGHLRWQYGWANPNSAGAFLATLEPVIWMTAALWSNKWRSKRICGSQFVAELVFWFLLTKTYSRGAIVAALGARVAWQTLQGELKAIRTWACYLLAPVVCIYSTGLGGRIYAIVTAADLSVEHRFEVWLAALRMVAASPWTGWGAGKSGIMFMNWYELPGHTEFVIGMVNSYLNLAVEHGLPVFCLIIFISSCVVYGGMSAARAAAKAGQPLPVVAAAASAWIAWLIGSIFSNLWTVPLLWIVPGAAGCAIVSCRQTWHVVSVPKMLACGLVALGLTTSLFLAGMAFERRSPILVHRDGNNTVILESRIHEPECKEQPAINVWLDPLVQGEHPGRCLRAWMQQPGGPGRLVVHTSFAYDPQPVQAGRIFVLVGRQVSLLQSLPILPADGFILVHPLEWSREDLAHLRGHKTVIVVPESDQAGTNSAIENAAHALGSKVLTSPGMGLDLSAAWPNAMTQALHAL